MPRVWMGPQRAHRVTGTGSIRRSIPIGVALMAGVLASSSAQAQCTSPLPVDGMKYFPFGAGGGVNALTSVISTVNTAFLNNGSAFVSAPAAEPNQQGGGVWVRAVGGTVDTQADSNFSGKISLPPWVPVPGVTPNPNGTTDVNANSSCRTKVEQDFKGFQLGHDVALLNADNSGMNWHFGGLAGYVASDFRDVTPGSGTLHGNFNVPFAGLYTAFSKGNFFADAQARLDYFQGDLTDSANGISNERLDARGYSITGNMGYRLDLGGGWSAEPSVGGVFSRTWVDPVAVPGNNFPIPVPNGTSSAGIVQIDRVDSELARASLKVGTAAALGSGIVAYPFVSASVFHEFAGNATGLASTAPAQAGAGTIDGALTVSRIGTYGVFSAGSAFALADTGWLGYTRVDYRTGANIDGFSVIGGLRYQINSDTAGLTEGGSLKDAPAEAYSWTGPYLGVHGGSTWGSTHWAMPMNQTITPDNAGYLLGGQLGYNYQVGRLVLGVEGDYGLSDARGAANCTTMMTFMSCEDDVKALGSVTGRLGFAFGRVLFYGKAGEAFGQFRAGTHANNPIYGTMSFPAASDTQWERGWTAGGGVELALSDKWSAKAEYMRYGFDEKTLAYQQNHQSAINASGEAVKIGVNYHLGSPSSAEPAPAPLK
jgi:opacity protein-like surface antigen